MARPCSTHPETGDVEQSIEVLDKVLSEFEDPDSLPPVVAIEPDSPSQGNQSEDDGYMSMNGRRNFPPLNDNIKHHQLGNSNRMKNFCPEPPPPPPTGTESSHTAQTTLPKARLFTQFPTSRFSSLPCASSPSRLLLVDNNSSNQPSEDAPDDQDTLDQDVNGGRTVLGIGISAVHDAVLRGVARIPVSIVNEHPVTIYPGRASPTKRQSHRSHQVSNVNNEIPRSRESSRNNQDNTDEKQHNIFIANSSTSPNNTSHHHHHHPHQHSPYDCDQQPQFVIPPLDPLNSNKIYQNDWKSNHQEKQCKSSDCDDDFSDDSLEGLSLPPPPPPIVVPPPPSLSAPVTPSKRASVAWEIRLDVRDNNTPKKSATTPTFQESSNKKDLHRTSTSESQSSLSTSEKSEASPSIEWPEPPEMPICSTEDEAASLYSDSDEFLLNIATEIKDHGTYVIRKGRKERHLLSDLIMIPQPPPPPNQQQQQQSCSPIHSNSNASSKHPTVEDHLVKTNSKFVSAIGMPFSRHSIDLGLASVPPPSHHHPNSSAAHHHPRSRLSLDLSSPTSELPPNTLLLHHNSNTVNSTPNCTTATTTTNNSGSNSSNNLILSPRYNEFKQYSSTFDALHALDVTNSNNHNSHGHPSSINNARAAAAPYYASFTGSGHDLHSNLLLHQSAHNLNHSNNNNNDNNDPISPLMRVSSVPAISPAHSGEKISTPRRELAPPIEEDEEQDSESLQGVAPLRQIENNISALLRGDIIVARVGGEQPRKPLGFRPGVHKSESAKEMLLSQNIFGPLPPSPPASASSPEEFDGFPPLPPTPPDDQYLDDMIDNAVDVSKCVTIHSKLKCDLRGRPRESSLDRPPAVPPHRGPSINTLKTRSMDAGFSKTCRTNGPYTSPHYPGHYSNTQEGMGSNTRRRYMSGAFPKRAAQSPREERRLQTSCSLPETPIFARGCDIPRTPHRRAPDLPSNCNTAAAAMSSGSRTAPRQSTGLNSSIIGNSIGNRQKSISQALAGGEMLRLSGGPARGWYPRQRQPRPASTENLDRLNAQASHRAWESGAAARKPLTLPPNMSPKFFNKSPREALRRVTSLLIRSKAASSSSSNKESKKEKEREKERDNVFCSSLVNHSPGASGDLPSTPHKKKGFFKSFWKKSKHYSLEQ